MKTLCVFTPTYNRAHTLGALHQSLLGQTCQDFDWLVVDDGSTDDTDDLMARLAEEAPFRIRYHKQANGGKQRAHNTGVELCENELFICVDSDDVMPANAVEDLLQLWRQVHDDPSIAGIIGLCGKDQDTPLQNGMPEGVSVTTMWDLYYKLGHRGDTALAHRTEILRQYPFVVAEGEKFIAEPFVYHQIDQHYKMAVLDRVLIVREYLSDGYTAHVRQITRDNPKGYTRLKRMYIEYSDTFSLRFRNSVLYMVGCMLGGSEHGVREAPYPIIAALAAPAAWLLCKTVYRERR